MEYKSVKEFRRYLRTI